MRKEVFIEICYYFRENHLISNNRISIEVDIKFKADVITKERKMKQFKIYKDFTKYLRLSNLFLVGGWKIPAY
jgi:YbbR domain-containing protein